MNDTNIEPNIEPNIGANELIFHTDKDEEIYSGGFNVNSIMMKLGLSPIMTLNTETKGGSNQVSDLFDNLVVPNWALSYNKIYGGNNVSNNKILEKNKINNESDSNNDSDNDSDDFIDDDLHDKLLDLVKHHDKIKKKKKTTKKNKQKEEKKNKTKKYI